MDNKIETKSDKLKAPKLPNRQLPTPKSDYSDSIEVVTKENSKQVETNETNQKQKKNDVKKTKPKEPQKPNPVETNVEKNSSFLSKLVEENSGELQTSQTNSMESIEDIETQYQQPQIESQQQPFIDTIYEESQEIIS